MEGEIKIQQCCQNCGINTITKKMKYNKKTTLFILLLMAFPYSGINGYSEPKCWPRFNLGNPNPAPVFCPLEDFFTYYDCCNLDYGDCCRYPKWGNIIIIIIIIIGIICGLCCCIFFIFQFARTKKVGNRPDTSAPTERGKEVECGTEMSLASEDKYYHRNVKNTYI